MAVVCSSVDYYLDTWAVPTIPFSGSFWYYPTSTAALAVLFGWWDDTVTSQKIEIRVNATAKMVCSVSGDPGLSSSATSTGSVNLNAWNYAQFAVNSADQCDIWLNGTKNSSSTTTTNFVGSATNDFAIGIRKDSSFPSAPALGALADIAIYSGVPTWGNPRVSPLDFYAGSLLRYYPLWNPVVATELKAGKPITATGSPSKRYPGAPVMLPLAYRGRDFGDTQAVAASSPSSTYLPSNLFAGRQGRRVAAPGRYR